jgi:hypothetical protein
MFNLAIDSKLPGCDVVELKVEDVAPNGYAVERATVRQKKTGQPARVDHSLRPAMAFGQPRHSQKNGCGSGDSARRHS